MKKILAPIALAALALISGACGGGGNSGWTAEEKQSIRDLYSIALEGEQLECSVDYTTEQVSFDEFMAMFAENMSSNESSEKDAALSAGMAKACNL